MLALAFSPLVVSEVRAQEAIAVPGGVVTYYHDGQRAVAEAGTIGAMPITPNAIAAAGPGRVIGYLPRFAAGPGYETWITTSDITGMGSGALYDWYDDSGKPFGLSVQTLSELLHSEPPIADVYKMGNALCANGTISSRMSARLDTPEVLFAGWIRVDAQEDLRSPGSSKPGAEIAATIYRKNQQGLVTGQATIPLTYPLTGFSMAARYLGTLSKPSRSGIAITNPDRGVTANVVLTLINDVGATVDEITVVLVGGQQIAQFLDQLFPKLVGSNLDGRLIVKSDKPIIGLSLRMDGDGEDFSFSTGFTAPAPGTP